MCHYELTVQAQGVDMTLQGGAINWVAVSAMLGLFQTLLLLIAAVVTVVQLREATRVRQVSSLMAVFEDFHSREMLVDRGLVNHASESELAAPTGELELAVRHIVGYHEWVALLVRRQLLPEKIVLDMYSNLFSESWRQLRKYIVARREREGFVNYAEHFEYLAHRSNAMRARRRW